MRALDEFLLGASALGPPTPRDSSRQHLRLQRSPGGATLPTRHYSRPPTFKKPSSRCVAARAKSSGHVPVPDVRRTFLAGNRVEGLRGPNRKAHYAFLDELARTGCQALGYRLTGPPVRR